MDIRLIFPPDEEHIELDFPIDNPELDIGGKLPINRLEGVSSIMTEAEGHNLWNNT